VIVKNNLKRDPLYAAIITAAEWCIGVVVKMEPSPEKVFPSLS
jgi:hypothetical protein